jgi:hypothetical protein
MIAGILALMSVVGGWLAWRRNPLYSTRSTLRLLVVMVLSIGGAILAIVATVNLTAHQSEPVVLAAMLTMVVVCALALIFVIQSASTPKEAQLATALPPSATLVRIHRQKVYPWAKFLAALLGVCAVLGFVIPGDARYAAFSLGGIALLVGAVLLPVMYVNARKFDRSLTGLELDPWIHWQYPPAQWQAWIEVRATRQQAKPVTFILTRDWKKLAWPCGFIAAGVLLFSPGTLLERSSYVLFCCGVISALVFAGTRSERSAAQRLRAKLLKTAPEAYFGHDGLFCDGIYLNWQGLSGYLVAAAIDERQPRSLLFSFEKVIPSPYTTNQILPIEQSVLIPSGADSDIARLQRELKARCPTARIALGG